MLAFGCASLRLPVVPLPPFCQSLSMRRGDTDEQTNTTKGRQTMCTTKPNTTHTPNNTGFPPVPPEARQQAGVAGQKREVQTSKATKTPRLNISREVKALNGTRGRGAYFVRVKHDREWNEIRVTLTDGTCKRAETFIDLGHTAETKAEALSEVRGTVTHFIAI
jgi:hypothetical protein